MKRKIRILIVDDNPLMRKSLKLIFKREKDFVFVGEAVDGLDAIAQAAKLNPDVILMDINMPEMDGIEATRIIHQASPNIKIVAHTANEEQDGAICAAGAVRILRKGISKKSILAAIYDSLQEDSKKSS